MKRRITKSLACLLVLTLIVSLLPFSAAAQKAAEPAVTGAYEGKAPDAEKGTVTLYFSGSGNQKIVYPEEGNGLVTDPFGNKLVYDAKTNTLTMNNLDAFAVEAEAMGALTIVLKGENTLNDITVFGNEGDETVTITGDGSLDLDFGIGLEDAAQLTIEDGVTITASDGIICVYYDPEGNVISNGYALDQPLVIKGRELSGGAAGHEKYDAVPLKEDVNPAWRTTARVYRNTTKPFADNSRFKDTETFAVYGLSANEVRKEDGEKHKCYKFAVNEAIFKDGEYYVGSHIDFLYAWDDSLLYKMFSNNLGSMRITDIDPGYVQIDLNQTDEDSTMLLDADGNALFDIAIVPNSSSAINRPRVTTAELPDAVEGKAYTAQITAQARNAGGKIVDYSLRGTASKWLSIDSAGRLSGKAPGFGIYQAIVSATEEANGQRAKSTEEAFVILVDVPDVCATFQKTISNGCSHTLTITDSKNKTVKTVSLGAKDLRPDTVIDLSGLADGSYTATLTGTITGATATYYNNSEAFTVKAGQRTMVTLDPDIEMDYGENTLLLKVTNLREAEGLKDITATVTMSNNKEYKKEVARAETLFPDLSKDASLSKVILTAKDDAGQVFEIASGDSATIEIDTSTFKTYRAYCYQSDIDGIKLSLNGNVFGVESWSDYTLKTIDKEHLPKFVGADFTEENKMKYRLEPEITVSDSSLFVTFSQYDKTAVLSGTVTDENGDPVAEAAITCSQTLFGNLMSYSATTDADGKYQFKNLYSDLAAKITAAKSGYSSARGEAHAVTADSVCNLSMESTGSVIVYSSEYVYDANLSWTGADSGSMKPSDGYTFVLPIAKSVSGSVKVTMTASNTAGKATGTMTVKSGKGELTLTPVLKGTIDWSGAGENASYTGYSVKIAGADYSRLFAPNNGGSLNVAPGEYTFSVLKPDSNAAYATQKITVEAGKTAYVTVSLPQTAQKTSVSSGKLTGPRAAANGETYQLKGLLTAIDGKKLEGLQFVLGDTYSWSDNIQHVVINGKKAKIKNGYVYQSDNPEIDWSLPLNFTVYCTQRADAKNPSQTVSAYVISDSTSLIGSVATRYIPRLTLRTVRAVGASKDQSQRRIPDAVSFVGQGEANTEIKLYDNGSLCAVVMTDAKGNYSGNLALSDSAYQHTIRAEANFGGETVSAESKCTYNADNAVLQSLSMNGSSIPINGGRLAYTTTPTGSVKFAAKFKNADMLDDITMTVGGKEVTSKVFFKVRKLSGYELLPATPNKAGDTWTSEAYAHGADYPTGVRTIYVNKTEDRSYSTTVGDIASVGAGNSRIAQTGAFSATFQNALERVDQYDKNNYVSAYDYDGWIKEITGDSDVLSDSSLSAAEKSSKLFELFSQKINQKAGENVASAITAQKAAERCPSDAANLRTYVDSPKDTVTDQNLQLRKTELEAKGYESCYYKDKTSNREYYIFTGTFYYDKNAQPVPELQITNIYNGVPTVEEDKRMFDNGKPLGSSLDVMYVCDYAAKKWYRTQTAMIAPGAASPIHTFSTQIPCKKEQPNEYKDYAVNPIAMTSAKDPAQTSLAMTGDPSMYELAHGDNVRIDLKKVSWSTFGGFVVGGFSYAYSLGAIPQLHIAGTIADKIKVVSPRTAKVLDVIEDMPTSAVGFLKLGDFTGDILPKGKEAPRNLDDTYWQAYLKDRMDYYSKVQSVASKTNATNNGGRLGDYRDEAALAGYMKNYCARMMNSFTEAQAAIEKGNTHNDRTEAMTSKLRVAGFVMACSGNIYGATGAFAADVFSFTAKASRETHDADLISALEKFKAELENFDKMDRDSQDTFRNTDDIVKRNRDKYPDTKTIEELLEEAGYDKPQPNAAGDDTPSDDDDPNKGDGGNDDDCDLEPVHDPSGVVYEAVLSNPVEGAAVTLYRYDGDEDPLSVWDDSDYLSQQNPLITDENGFYRWDVPEGEWYVTAAKDGYVSGSSQNDKAANVKHGDTNYLPVLPPQLEVNIPLISYKAPEVESVSAKTDGVYITFSKYLDETTLTADKFTLTDASGKAVAFTLEKLDSEQAPANINYGGAVPSYTKTVRLTTKQNNGALLTLQIADTLHSYADVAMTSTYADVLTVADKATLNAPIFSAEGGEVDKGTPVTISCGEGAEIIYTTDGSDPTADNGTRAKSGVQITVIAGIVVKAIAVSADAETSDIATAEYTIKKVQIPEGAEMLLLGDVDGDGEVTILDATLIQRHLASLPTSAYRGEVADTDGDGEVTIIDATGIQRWLAGLSCPEGIGQPI